jgi:uncharacterized protein YnzC (UPF0291/DUF896 family)
MMHPEVLEALEELAAKSARSMSDAILAEQSVVTQIYIQAIREELDRRMKKTIIGDVAGHA